MSDRAREVDLSDPRAPRLDILKALGDNTRYAIYLELARSPIPLATAEIAEILGLHVNTVRPHLERMREVGLLQVEAEARGGVGRPQHRYSLAAGAPSLGLEPSPYPLLATVLLQAAAEAGLDGSELTDAAHEQGRADARRWDADADPIDALMIEQARLGFDPTVVDGDGCATVAFAHCPFRSLAESYPDLVCSVHCGLVEGLVDELGGAEVTGFHSLVDRTPCQVEVARI
ncbi:MAG: helix-turn-helix domain-containing protein [Acidimicrobiales bacterium]